MDIKKPPLQSHSSRSAQALEESLRNLKNGRARPASHRALAVSIVIWLCSALFVALLVLTSFLGYRAVTTSQAITLESAHSSSFFSELKNISKTLFSGQERETLRGEAQGRVNILLLGRAGETYPGKNLTDTIMIASVDTTSKKVALLSLPRDLYVPIPKTGFSTKLNSLYQYGLNSGTGIDPLKASIENITGLSLHYFAIIDFDGFEKVVDALGGVQVEVMRDIYDTRYPGKNYSYETFELKKGRQKLDGKTALKYVRERHDDPEGDFGRAKRQQQVLQALKDRAFSPGVFLNVFTIDSLLATLGESIKTDMPLAHIESLFQLSQGLDTENVHTVVVDAWKKESLLRSSHVMVGPTRVFTLVPRAGPNNWKEVEDVALNIFRREGIDERKRRIAEEQVSITIAASRGNLSAAQTLRSLIRDEWNISAVVIETNSRLENAPGESIIVDRSNLTKPYSLDELLKRFPLEKQAALPQALASLAGPDTDFVIIVGHSLQETLARESNTGTPEVTLDAEALAPQPTTR